MPSPIRTREMIENLTNLGYQCTYSNIQSYMRDRLLTPIKNTNKSLGWNKNEIKKVKAILTRLDRGPSK